MNPVASDLAGLLEASGLSLQRNNGGAVPAGGWNLFTAPLPPGDGTRASLRAVSIVRWGGDRPEGFMGAGRRSIRRVRCQVTVRSPVEDFANGETLADACLDALHLVDHASYLKIEVEQSAPNYLPPQNPNGSHFWTFDVTATWDHTP